MRLAVSLALTALSAVAYGLAFPTTSLRLLAWVALMPFFAALRCATVGRALALGWVWTTVAAYVVGDWFASSIARYYAQPIAVGIAFFFGVSSLMAAPYYMAFAACYRVLVRRRGAAAPFLVAAAWVGAEIARTTFMTGNPWALLGYSQIGVDRLVQIADVTGVYGITFALVSVNAALVELCYAGESHRRPALLGAAAAAIMVTALLGYGQLRLSAAADEEGRPVTVAMIQGNLDLGTEWRADFYGSNLGTYLRLTHGAITRHEPEIVFWPESALTFFLEEEPLYRQTIASVLAPRQAQLVVGGVRKLGQYEPFSYYNSVFLLSPEGAILATYEKQRLVPFGEYFPFAGLDVLNRRFARVREFTPAPPSAPLPTVAGPAGVMICNEAMFPEIAAERVREGAVYLVDPAHDTWLTPKFSAQQFDIVRLRTVEQRRYLVRASTSGPSAIVDPFGRVIVRTEFFTSTAIGGHIRPRTTVTPYYRVGDLFAYGCVLVALWTWVARRWRGAEP